MRLVGASFATLRAGGGDAALHPRQGLDPAGPSQLHVLFCCGPYVIAKDLDLQFTPHPL